MTKQQISAVLKELSIADLYNLKEQLEEQISDKYFEDDNFSHRETIDSYYYAVVYDDLSYHYDCIGKKAYNEYIKDDHAIRIECKTKELFPQWKVLMQKGDNIEYQETRIRHQFY